MPDRRPTLPLEHTDSGVHVQGLKQQLRVADRQPVELDKVMRACDLLAGKGSAWLPMLYLGRAHGDELHVLFDATTADDPQVRWKRLWILVPFFAKAARHTTGRQLLVQRFAADLHALFIVTRMLGSGNRPVARLFKRLHDELLDMLLEQVWDQREHPARFPLLIRMLAAIERKHEVLMRHPAFGLDSERLEALRPHVVMDDAPARLDTQKLGDKLKALAKTQPAGGGA